MKKARRLSFFMRPYERSDTQLTEAVFQYPGGKARIAGWIADRLPPPGSYSVFVDVFGGSASVLLEVMRRCERAGKKILFVFND